MIDVSLSMTCPAFDKSCGETNASFSRWDAVTKATKSFLNAPESATLGVGVGFFPRMGAKQSCLADCGLAGCACVKACGCTSTADVPFGAPGQFCACSDNDTSMSCNPDDYEPANVEIAELPAAAAQLAEAIDKQQLASGTPTAPALHGALKHAQRRSTEHPDRRIAVVYVTDGEPAGCEPNNTISAAMKVAAEAAEATPSILTYVIGIGPELQSLNRIAVAGGTELAYLVDANSNAMTAFTEALDNIRTRALTCDYEIPKSESLDFNLVNVRVTVGAGAPSTLLPQASSSAACLDNEGWYYDDAANPKLISLCPTTCKTVMSTPGSQLDVLIGCKTVVR
jgi:hypothetical protein